MKKNQPKSVDYANDREIFVGKDPKENSYYLLTDSIYSSSLDEVANGITYYLCRIKIVHCIYCIALMV